MKKQTSHNPRPSQLSKGSRAKKKQGEDMVQSEPSAPELKMELSLPKGKITLPRMGFAQDVLSQFLKEEEGQQDLPETLSASGVLTEEVKETELPLKVITFYLNQEEYGLPLAHVQDINRIGPITRVPNALS